MTQVTPCAVNLSRKPRTVTSHTGNGAFHDATRLKELQYQHYVTQDQVSSSYFTLVVVEP